jgi:NADH:ubiquinone oxidoreductase subunit 6 (subunit J)
MTITITPDVIIWFIMAIFILGGGFGVIISRNLIHGAMYLILALFGMAGMFILLEAPFLAAVQILVYVGAISVLITITIMVTRRVMGATENINRQWPLAALIGVLVFGVLGFVILNQFGWLYPSGSVRADYISQLGTALVDHQGFLLPFEVASVLLLAAMIGSIVVARDK